MKLSNITLPNLTWPKIITVRLMNFYYIDIFIIEWDHRILCIIFHCAIHVSLDRPRLWQYSTTKIFFIFILFFIELSLLPWLDLDSNNIASQHCKIIEYSCFIFHWSIPDTMARPRQWQYILSLLRDNRTFCIIFSLIYHWYHG